MTHYIRLSDSLVFYWEELKGENKLPLESQIDPKDLAEIWDDCFLVQITEHGYKYDYLGKNLIDAYGEEFKKEEVELFISPGDHRLAEKFDEVANLKEPTEDQGEFYNSDNVLIKYRQLLLPFATTNKDKVDRILGGMRWTAS